MFKNKINFLAHQHSPHVLYWVRLMERSDFTTEIYSLRHRTDNSALFIKNSHYIEPNFFRFFPASVRYFVCGLYLRLSRFIGKGMGFIHAHNASGYGFMAWLSGDLYGLTVYGSEIYDAPNRGLIYRIIMKSILRKSLFITSSCSQMTNVLIREFGVDAKKIKEISFSVPEVFTYSFVLRKKMRSELKIGESERVWVANRRISPHYNTLDLIQAFNLFSLTNPKGILILLQGNSDFEYFKHVVVESDQNHRIKLIQGFLSQEDLNSYLCASDFSISIPNTDQLSSSILESMNCKLIPIINDLPAYEQIKDVAITLDLHSCNMVECLCQVFETTSMMSEEELEFGKNESHTFVVKNFSIESSIQKIRNLYSGVVIGNAINSYNNKKSGFH